MPEAGSTDRLLSLIRGPSMIAPSQSWGGSQTNHPSWTRGSLARFFPRTLHLRGGGCPSEPVKPGGQYVGGAL